MTANSGVYQALMHLLVDFDDLQNQKLAETAGKKATKGIDEVMEHRLMEFNRLVDRHGVEELEGELLSTGTANYGHNLRMWRADQEAIRNKYRQKKFEAESAFTLNETELSSVAITGAVAGVAW